MFTHWPFRSNQEVRNAGVTENATNPSLHHCFGAVVLNRSITPAPIVRPLISYPQACGLVL